jgi:hypothetical protein
LLIGERRLLAVTHHAHGVRSFDHSTLCRQSPLPWTFGTDFPGKAETSDCFV